MDTQALMTEIKSFQTDLNGRMDRQQIQLDQMRAEMLRPNPGAPGGGNDGAANFKDFTTPGTRFTKDADIELLKKTNRIRFQVDGFHPRFEQKTLIDSAALGFSTPGILGAQRIEDGIVPLPRRRLVARDLLRSKPITAGQSDWITELALTNSASPQTEGQDKGESANTFAIQSEKTRTLAHWLPISKQAADDLPELRRFIDENLIYGLKVIEEWELLFGDGSGEHLHGVAHQATPYAATYATSGDTKLDKLRHAILELEDDDEECTAFIMNPRDVHDIDLIKTEASGSTNTGSYVVGNPLGGVLRVRTFWGRAVVSSNVMPSGKFLAGNFANAVIGDRMGATIDVSESHDDFWIKNKLAIRCEERISLAVLRAGSFRFGDL